MEKLLKTFNLKPDNLLHIAWIQAIIATLASLYASEIAHFPPCVLCWYQRIFMYPLVFIIPIAIQIKDKKNLPYFVIPMAAIGSLIGVYHNLLYWKILPESAAPCINGVSCTTKFIEFYGFITIPFLSLLAFLVILTSMFAYHKISNTKK